MLELRSHPRKGRGMHAARDIQGGETVLTEPPLLLVPSPDLPGQVCCGCMRVASLCPGKCAALLLRPRGRGYLCLNWAASEGIVGRSGGLRYRTCNLHSWPPRWRPGPPLQAWQRAQDAARLASAAPRARRRHARWAGCTPLRSASEETVISLRLLLTTHAAPLMAELIVML